MLEHRTKKNAVRIRKIQAESWGHGGLDDGGESGTARGGRALRVPAVAAFWFAASEPRTRPDVRMRSATPQQAKIPRIPTAMSAGPAFSWYVEPLRKRYPSAGLAKTVRIKQDGQRQKNLHEHGVYFVIPVVG